MVIWILLLYFYKPKRTPGWTPSGTGWRSCWSLVRGPSPWNKRPRVCISRAPTNKRRSKKVTKSYFVNMWPATDQVGLLFLLILCCLCRVNWGGMSTQRWSFNYLQFYNTIMITLFVCVRGCIWIFPRSWSFLELPTDRPVKAGMETGRINTCLLAGEKNAFPNVWRTRRLMHPRWLWSDYRDSGVIYEAKLSVLISFQDR